jgi:methionine-S-sulfoxide reductase
LPDYGERSEVMLKIILYSLFIFIAVSVQAKQKATLAAGCFWGVEEFYRKIPGVLETGVGYTGGTKTDPTYYEVTTGKTGHAEAVEIIFDEKKVSYEKLLDWFFKFHDPTTLNKHGNDVGTQYRSAIFYHDEKQKIAAENFIKKVEKSKAWKSKIVTEVTKATKFYEAEEEHQKYLLRNPKGYDNHYLRKISFD